MKKLIYKISNTLIFTCLIGVSLNAQVTADFSFSADTVCSKGFSPLFDTKYDTAYDQSTVSTGDSIIQYKWEFGNSSYYLYGPNLRNYTSFGFGPNYTGNQPVKMVVYTTNGYSDSITKFVYVRDAPKIIATWQPDNCIGDTVQISTTVSGGQPPYTYYWVDHNWPPDTSNIYHSNMKDPIIIPDTPIYYEIYHGAAIDQYGCKNWDTVIINTYDTVSTNAGPDLILCGNDPPVSLSGSPTGGSWSGPGVAGNIFDPATAGLGAHTLNYSVTNSNGCTGTDTKLIIVNSATSFLSKPSDTTICKGDTIQLEGIAAGADSIHWNGVGYSCSSCPPLKVNPVTTTTYSYTVIDTFSCGTTDSITVTVDDDCVWPGDANYDGVANNFDILNIGIGFGDMGAIRPNATTNWTAQMASDWVDTFANNINYKHADTDGDGIIDDDDTLAVSLNYGLTHLKTGGANGTELADPVLFVEIPDTMLPNTTYTAPIIFGDSNLSVSNVYGIAFTFQYDKNIIDSATMTLSNGTSWMGTNGVNLLEFGKDFYSQGEMDVAVTRTDQQNVSGQGPISSITFTLQDDISGKKVISTSISIKNVRAVDKDGQTLTVFAKETTGSVLLQESGNPEVPGWEKYVKIYPNPASDIVNISSPQAIEEISVLDAAGRLIEHQVITGDKQATFSTEILPDNWYLIKIQTAHGIIYKKLLIIK